NASRWQGTPGKMMLKLKTVEAFGSRPPEALSRIVNSMFLKSFLPCTVRSRYHRAVRTRPFEWTSTTGSRQPLQNEIGDGHPGTDAKSNDDDDSESRNSVVGKEHRRLVGRRGRARTWF